MKPLSGPARSDTRPWSETWLPWAILIAAVAFYIWHSWSTQFLQDDSYITYRYARNIVRGLGPVFNPGERVEGYTNFLWTMLLAGLGVLRVPFSTIITLSQVIGVLCGAGVLVLFFLFLRRHTQASPALATLPVLLMAVNGSFAYWTVSGMETGLFALLVAAGLFCYLDEPTPARLIAASGLLGLSALTRPEGALFEAVVGLHFILTRLGRRPRPASVPPVRTSSFGLRTFLTDGLRLALPFLALVLPLYVWRLSYYGSLFPNTFYAKTGASLSYLKSGLTYLWEFHRAYGLCGAVGAFILAAAAALRRRLDKGFYFAVLLLVVHSIYTVAVGGDVLRIYRFFVAVLVLLYLALYQAIRATRIPGPAQAFILLGLAPLTFWGPFGPGRPVRADILRNRMLERGLVAKMSGTGLWLGRNLASTERFACTTIGAVSYFADRDMVDMLGLTDSTIARHPEDILGTQVYWKERNYNTRYLLERRPTYIYFSTGMKPSAAAERALFLRKRFRVGYFPCPVTMPSGAGYFDDILYKAKPGAETLAIDPPDADPEFVRLYNYGINMLRVGLDSAAATFRRCQDVAPPDFGYVYEELGQIALQQNKVGEGIRLLEQAVAIEDWCVNSHLMLGSIYARAGDLTRAAEHMRKATEYAPDYYAGYINLSVVLTRLNRYEAAESILTRASVRFPGVPDLRQRLSQLRAARPQPPVAGE